MKTGMDKKLLALLKGLRKLEGSGDYASADLLILEYLDDPLINAAYSAVDRSYAV